MISVDLIKKLRGLPGAGVVDCREALEKSGGDLKNAMAYLRSRGMEKAEKKADRDTGCGRVFSYVHATGKVGVVLSLLCETDFVARTDEFLNLGKELCLQIASMTPSNVKELLKQEYIRDNKMTISDMIKQVIGKLGENIKVGEFHRTQI